MEIQGLIEVRDQIVPFLNLPLTICKRSLTSLSDGNPETKESKNNPAPGLGKKCSSLEPFYEIREILDGSRLTGKSGALSLHKARRREDHFLALCPRCQNLFSCFHFSLLRADTRREHHLLRAGTRSYICAPAVPRQYSSSHSLG